MAAVGPKRKRHGGKDVKEEVLQIKKRKSLVQAVKEKPVVVQKPAENTALDWPVEDISKLIENISLLLPKTDTQKYSTQVEKMDWAQVSFGSYTPEDCREKWKEVLGKLRRFRTLSELVVDARDWIKHPWMRYTNSKTKAKHPDLPKKPLTPYFLYFLEKREKYSKDNPSMSMTDLAKLLAKKYSDLPEKKKQKYKDNYQHQNANYKGLMEIFRVEHPDLYPETVKTGKAAVKRVGPSKPLSPCNLFMEEKMTKHTNLDPAERKEYEEKYKDMWKALSDSKRVKWIRKSIADEKAFEIQMAQFCVENPDFKHEPKKSVVSKPEKELLDKLSGKPVKPPSSGYSLFSKILLKELTDFPSNQKMVEISRRWREMTEKGKQEYVSKALQEGERYQVELTSYLASLPEDERKALELQKKGKGSLKVPKKQESKKSVAASKNKPLSAMAFYQQEKFPVFMSRYPDKSEQELNRLITKEFTDMSEKKREKYKKLADAQNQNGSSPPAVKTDCRKPQLFKGEPRKPPVKPQLFKGEPKKPLTSGYLLYTSELIPKMVKVEPKQRMVEISKRWKALTPAEQEKYKKKSIELTKKYIKDHAKFIAGLSEVDHQQYTEMKTTSAAKKSAAAKGKALAKVKIEPVEEESEEDDDDDDKESEKDNDSSNDSDSDSDSSSSDESDKSGSGSDSDSKSDADSSGSSNSDSDNTKDGSSDSSSDDSDSNGSGSDADSSSGSDK